MCKFNCSPRHKYKCIEIKLIYIKAVKTIDHVTGWFKITQDNDKIEIPIQKNS